jgi:hypothetical protein
MTAALMCSFAECVSHKEDITESKLQLAHFFQEPLQEQLLLLRLRPQLLRVRLLLGWALVEGLHSARSFPSCSLYSTFCRL